MLFVNYPKCSTCQKARKWLTEHHLEFEDRDIKGQNPDASELKAWHQKSGLPLKRFFNTSGILYKEMNSMTCWPPTECSSNVPSS